MTAGAALGLVGRVVLGLAFVLSGYVKAITPAQEFALVIESYDLLPAAWSVPMASVLPWAELLLGAALLTGFFRRESAALLGGLAGLFIWALVTAQARGIDLGTCGCFGRLGPQLKPWQATLMDVTFAFLAFAVWRDLEGRFSLDRWIEAAPPEAAAAAPPSKKSRKA